MIQLLAPDFVSIVILTIVFFYGLRKGYVFDSGEKNFRLIVFFELLMTVFDVFCYSLNARTGSPAFYYGNVISNVLYFIVQPIPAYFVLLYGFDLVDKSISLKNKLLLAIPLLVNAGMAIASAFIPVIFTVDPAANAYQREDFMAFTIAIGLLYILMPFLMICLKKPHFPLSMILVFSSIFFLPLFGVIIQVSVPIPTDGASISIGCSCSAIATLLIFLYIVMRNTQSDSLTGLNNRKQFEECLRSLLGKHRHKNYFIGMMLDINKFKAINDTFGHREGDAALTNAARILKTAVGNSGFLARYAGDEFVVLIETDDQTEGQKIYGRIREQENLMNAALRKPYDIHFAVGYVTYTKNDQVSVDGFLDAIDKKMYADKRGLI